jgi:hypothetical protein
MSNIGKLRTYLQENWYDVSIWAFFSIAVLAVLLFRLNRLTGGISPLELHAIGLPSVHQLISHPLGLPLLIVQLLLVKNFGVGHVAHIARLANVVVGFLAIIVLTRLVYLWHGQRTALMTGGLFAAAAWTLHVSRFVSFDVTYLLALPLLLLVQAVIHRPRQSKWVIYGSMLIWVCLLYIPGMLWFLLLSLFWIRQDVKRAWQSLTNWWQRALYVLAAVIWLPILVHYLATSSMAVRAWLGFPARLPSISHLGKNLLAVPTHLFIRGPQYPLLWLGKLPILDIFSLVCCIIGIYFYVRHYKASRSRIILSFLVLGTLLVSLGGPVGLSVLIPLLYILIGTGITYLLREWLQIFPINPLARSIGIGFVVVAVALSCVYNLRSYYVAWPHDPTTIAIFRSQR